MISVISSVIITKQLKKSKMCPLSLSGSISPTALFQTHLFLPLMLYPERQHVFQVTPPKCPWFVLSEPTRCYHQAMMELLTPTKAQRAAVNLPPPTCHISPYCPVPSLHTSTLYLNSM